MISVFLIVATSIDGYIGTSDNHLSTKWTSDEDRKRFVKLTKEARVMVMGRKTFDTIGKALSGRKIIVCSRESGPEIEGVEFTIEKPRELLSRLENEGFTEVAICGGGEIYSLFLESGVVQRIYQTIEPVVFGTGTRLFSRSFFARYRLRSMVRPNPETGTVFLEYALS